MSKCSDHKTTFPDTHRHFCLAPEISRKYLIVFGSLELGATRKQNILDYTANEWYLWTCLLSKKSKDSLTKKQGISNAQFRTKITPELCIRSPLFCSHIGYQKYNCIYIHLYFLSLFLYISIYIHSIYRYMRIYICIYMYIYI